MSVLFSKILTAAPSVSVGGVFATVIGSNIGAFLTPVGALAGIMWSNLLRKNGIKITFLQFIKYGAVIGVASVSAALCGLYFVI
jgi:arsenical pump membrane protein